MEPKASVIIPVYNAEKTLRRCVESLVLGSERNIEVILVEDHSPDKSWTLCQELAAEFLNVLCVQNPKNCGVSYTRNHGLEHARGEYVLFVDSDDWVSGRYVQMLVDTANRYPDHLALCSMRFINRVANYTQDFYWDGNKEKVALVGRDRFFDLADSFFLQSPCNKAFRRKNIEAYHIRFDESQSMGEDFQFVLDYIEAAQIKKCVVLNEALYYYIRWNNASLMSNFGPSTKEKAISRFDQLRRICGEEDKSVQLQHDKAVRKLAANYIYHTVRASNLAKKEKLEIIQSLTLEASPKEIYFRQKFSVIKEQLATTRCVLANQPKRVKGKLQSILVHQKLNRLRNALTGNNCTIISQNCIGGVFYHDMHMQFLSPTVGLLFLAKDCVKFALNLKHYLNCDLQLRWEETYPVGVLDDITVHFMHYESCQAAKESWERRKARVNYNKIVVVSTDRNGFDDDTFETWKALPYPKVLFTVHSKFAQEPGSVFFPQYCDQNFVPDLIPNREFYKNGILMHTINHLGG